MARLALCGHGWLAVVFLLCASKIFPTCSCCSPGCGCCCSRERDSDMWQNLSIALGPVVNSNVLQQKLEMILPGLAEAAACFALFSGSGRVSVCAEGLI